MDGSSLALSVFLSFATWCFAGMAMAPAALSGRPAWMWLGLPVVAAAAMFMVTVAAFTERPGSSVADPVLRRRLRRQFRRSRQYRQASATTAPTPGR